MPDTEVKPLRAFQFQLRPQLNTAAHLTPAYIMWAEEPVSWAQLTYIVMRNKSFSLKPLHLGVISKTQHSQIYSVHINSLGDIKLTINTNKDWINK